MTAAPTDLRNLRNLLLIVLLLGATPLSRAAGDAGRPPHQPDPNTGSASAASRDLPLTAANGRTPMRGTGPKAQSVASMDTASVGSAAPVALSSDSIGANTVVYQARFDRRHWSGQLLAYKIDPATGAVKTAGEDVVWNGGHVDALGDFDARTILTINRTTTTAVPTGVAFRTAKWPRCASGTAASAPGMLSCSLVFALRDGTETDTAGKNRLNHIRGQSDNERQHGGPFRDRTRICGPDGAACMAGDGVNKGVLGDIVASAPLYVGAPPFDYRDSGYASFRNDYAARTPMVYVGANDGMLHGFNARTGIEELAYVPEAVSGNLRALTDPAYSHRYYVDGSPNAGDVQIRTSPATRPEWRTILVSGLRKGGQGVFALDITNPEAFEDGDAAAARTVLWEFTDRDDADLGYTFSRPLIARTNHGGKWAVIVGNGYDSDERDAHAGSGRAAIYILFVEDGRDGWHDGDFVKIPVPDTTTSNGLSSPTAVDANSDGRVDYVYAGDLRGNMWKFDISSADRSGWTAPSSVRSIFTATDAGNRPQPIMSRPEIGAHPAGQRGHLILFGTGKQRDSLDPSPAAGPAVQSFYGIWDSGGTHKPARGDLLKQSVVSTRKAGGSDFRIVSSRRIVWPIGGSASNARHTGWYIDLPIAGEYVTSDPVLRAGRIIFTTAIPSENPRAAGGDGWLMELDAGSGGHLHASPFDVNNDGAFSSLDLLPIGAGPSARRVAAGGISIRGIPTRPAILVGGPASLGSPAACRGAECRYVSSSTGKIEHRLESLPDCNYCRASWRQVR